jgi:hypothetical protein
MRSCGADGDAEVVEEGLPVDAEGFVVTVDASPAGGLRPSRGLRTPARIGPMTCSRRVRRAARVPAAWARDLVAAVRPGWVIRSLQPSLRKA